MRAADIAIHLTRRLAPLLALAAAVAGLVGGGGIACKRAEPDPAAERVEGPPEKMELAWEEGAIPGAPLPKPVIIKEGPAPLVYLSEMAATLRVVDRADDEVLAEAAVEPRTIVLVDTQRGVVFGGRTLVAGPLAGRRRYAIYLVPHGESVSRSGVSQPVKQDEPEDAETATPEAEE